MAEKVPESKQAEYEPPHIPSISKEIYEMSKESSKKTLLQFLELNDHDSNEMLKRFSELTKKSVANHELIRKNILDGMVGNDKHSMMEIPIHEHYGSIRPLLEKLYNADLIFESWVEDYIACASEALSDGLDRAKDEIEVKLRDELDKKAFEKASTKLNNIAKNFNAIHHTRTDVNKALFELYKENYRRNHAETATTERGQVGDEVCQNETKTMLPHSSGANKSEQPDQDADPSDRCASTAENPKSEFPNWDD